MKLDFFYFLATLIVFLFSTHLLLAEEIDSESITQIQKHLNLAIIFTEEEAYSLAENQIKKALDLDPNSIGILVEMGNDNPELLINAGNIYARQGLFEEAISWYKMVLEKDPANGKALSNIGICYRYMEDYSKAEEFLLKAIESNPQQSLYYANLSKTFLLAGDIDNAKIFLAQAKDRMLLESNPKMKEQAQAVIKEISSMLDE